MVKFETCKIETRDTNDDILGEIENKPLSQFFKDGSSYFVITDNGKVVGTATEHQIRYKEPITTEWFDLDEQMFIRARDWYREHERERGKRFVVVDADGHGVGILYWQENILKDKFNPNSRVVRPSQYFDYDFQKDGLNSFLLDRAYSYVFLELEEYTHAIANWMLKHHPERDVYFKDEAAAFPIWGNESGHIHVFRDWNELPTYKKCMFITSQMFLSISQIFLSRYASLPNEADLVYNSIEVMWAALWGKKLLHLGSLHPDLRVAILDMPHGHGNGLNDIATEFCNYAYQAKMQGFVPVVDLTAEDCCVYAERGKNAWTEIFQPISGLSLDEARQCCNVIFGSMQELRWNRDVSWRMGRPYWEEVALRNDYNDYFRRCTRLSDATWRYVLDLAPSILRERLSRQAFAETDGRVGYADEHQQVSRVLGVNIRGTDYRPEAQRRRKATVWNAGLDLVFAWCHSLIASGNYEYIYLCTEDLDYFEKFLKEFGKEKTIFVNRRRIYHDYQKNDNILVPQLFINQEGSQIDVVRSYITELKCLTACDDVISSNKTGAWNLMTSWNNGRFGLMRVIKEKPVMPYSSRVARIDLKNVGEKNNKIEIIFMEDKESYHAYYPDWFSNQNGSGGIVDIMAEECFLMKAHIRCFGNGTMNINCKAMDYRKNGKRLPLWVTYTSLMINNEEQLSAPIDVWHDQSFTCKKQVVDGEEFDLEIHWQPFKYQAKDVSGLLQQIL